MRGKIDREEFRRIVKILIPQMEKSEIVNHFEKQGYPRQTMYYTINRMQLGGTINDKKKTGRPTSQKNQLKRWTNNRQFFLIRMVGSRS